MMSTWKRSYDSSHTLDLGLVVLNVRYAREHPRQWYGWTAEVPGGCYLARAERLKRYPDEARARQASETWARRRIETALRALNGREEE
jgi:hypothetical protein